MRSFITGATGFIGSHVAEALHAKGHELRCLVRRTSDLRWIKHLPIEYVHGDLFDHDLLRESVRNVDYVYHIAGITKAKTKAEYYRGNHIATKNILEAVGEANPHLRRFIHVSSQAAVGPSPADGAIDETVPFHPITTYGISKMEAEKACLAVQASIPLTIVRPPAVYGPRDKDVFAFFETMKKGLQPMIGFTNKLVSLIHVKDLTDGIILAGEHPGGAGQTYFISSERYYNWREVGDVTARVMQKRRILRLRIPEFGVYMIAAVAEILGSMSSKPVLLNIEKAKDIVQDAWTCNASKAMRDLCFRESLTLEEGIRNTVEWYRTNNWL